LFLAGLGKSSFFIVLGMLKKRLVFAGSVTSELRAALAALLAHPGTDGQLRMLAAYSLGNADAVHELQNALEREAAAVTSTRDGRYYGKKTCFMSTECIMMISTCPRNAREDYGESSKKNAV
jgi:hypothetical protein